MHDAMNLGYWRESPKMRHNVGSIQDSNFCQASANFLYGAATPRVDGASAWFFPSGLLNGRVGQRRCSMQQRTEGLAYA